MKRWIFVFAILFYSSSHAGPIKVYVDVVGDLFHAGHVAFFKQAKELGDYLIVGVIKDDLVTDYKRQPILTNEERVAIIEACRYVDEVIPNAPLGVTEELIEDYHIDLVVHGDDFDEKKVNAQYLPALQRGIFRLVPYTKGISTSDIIDRILLRVDNDPAQLQKKEFVAN